MSHVEILYRFGKFARIREYCERGIALCDPLQRRSHVFLFGNDTDIGCRIFEALALWHLGYPDQALSKGREMLILAQDLSHPFTLAFALYFAAVLHQLCREVDLVQERTDPLLEIAAERGFALYSAWGTVLHGWALAEQGRVVEGIARMQQGLAAWRAMGAELLLPHFLSFLAQAYGKAGEAEKGLALLAEALALVDKNGECCWEAELNRIKGELLLKHDGAEARFRGAEACFQDALTIARRQSTRSWELRAAASLSRLWHREGRNEEAWELLQGVYGGFTEGFGTADLEEARALLDALA